METLKEILENDKTLVIFAVLIFGILAIAMRVEGSMALIDKLAVGLFGMAVGKSLK